MWFIKWYAPEKVKPQHPLKNILYFETCFRVQTLKFINCYWNYKPLLYTQKNFQSWLNMQSLDYQH